MKIVFSIIIFLVLSASVTAAILISLKKTEPYIDYEKPIITLNGELNSKITLGSTFEEPGYSATDNYDGDITSEVVVKNALDTSKIGKYEIAYKVKDSSGNEATETRFIEVIHAVSSIFPTYIDGILLVNKQNPIPADFGGQDAQARPVNG